ncbi:UNVERIFIED_CONTAM: hypothetical protein FKN15_046336 [Acipenser sinensis]
MAHLVKALRMECRMRSIAWTSPVRVQAIPLPTMDGSSQGPVHNWPSIAWVACAHLYELRQRFRQPSETRDPIGRCYVLSEDLTVRDDLDGGEWKFCEGRPQGHEQFGFCQQGMAAGFTPDNSYILFGAPGTYHWKGELRLQLVNLTGLDRGVFDDGPYEVADEKLQDSRLIPLQYNSYLGLLFMASPVEDALVYRTLDPSDRGTSFEDVAQNSYLGIRPTPLHRDPPPRGIRPAALHRETHLLEGLDPLLFRETRLLEGLDPLLFTERPTS